MRFSPILLFLSTSSALALHPRATCPQIWTTIFNDLQPIFAGCGRDAHGAIRAPFHDCINNGCDGSLLLTDECLRPENAGLPSICTKLRSWSAKYSVGAADMIQFAAAAAIASCPLGPRVQALVGRKDRAVAAPLRSVPSNKDSVDKMLGAFAEKGLSAEDLVALLGTHSVAVQVFDDPLQAGKSLDSTPSVCDMNFYTETKAGHAPYSLQSDRLISNDTMTAATWDKFASSRDAWTSSFVSAWNRFAVIGNDVGSLVDCSSVITIGGSKSRRQ